MNEDKENRLTSHHQCDKEEAEDSRRILQGAVELFCQERGLATQNKADDVPENDMLPRQEGGKVVEYLKPEVMLAKLFDSNGSAPNRSLSLRRKRKQSGTPLSDNDADSTAKAS